MADDYLMTNATRRHLSRLEKPHKTRLDCYRIKLFSTLLEDKKETASRW